jgi:hypothetical protein
MRLAQPLTIPYYPLPGVLACLILDAADQTIFQQFPGIALDRYQSYDKALDIYYLAITYLATMRNWTNRPAFRMSQFLYYYRLVGVVAFELSQVRMLLLIFPNTFEYFFIFYEAVRARWNTARLTGVAVVIAAALIWVFIKLPQEWWIHIAKLDVTEALGRVDRRLADGSGRPDRRRRRRRRRRLLDCPSLRPVRGSWLQVQGRPSPGRIAGTGSLPHRPGD